MTKSKRHNTLDGLNRRIDGCMTADLPRLRSRLRQVRRRARERKSVDRLIEEIEQRIAESHDRVRTRQQHVPTVTYPQDLPVADRRDEIKQAITDHQVVIVCGATGSGKTTQLPKMCLEVGRGVRGLIGHTQPRRLAARAVSARIAEELDCPLGREVGYKMRFNDRTAAETMVKVMTDGILLAEIVRDRRLDAYDTIIIDEAHERSLNIDFLLGYLKRLLRQRRDLKLIITSATIDPHRFSEHFDDAPIIDVEGRMYTVEVRYRPRDAGDDDELRDVNEAISDALAELATVDNGDVLVFLPGERDIREAAEVLSGDPSVASEVLPLYARLPTAKQDRIFHPRGGRRIILATNVAETSLTVPRIRHVIDTGVARISRYASRSKVQRLPVERISQASAEQRKGRCGRLAPGVCLRLYDEADFEARPTFTEPEIQRTNLAGVILQMLLLDLGDPREFPFLDPPAGRLIRDGYDTLHELGALDDRDRLTPIGRDLARMPVDPRVGRMILAGRDEHCLREILVIAAVLSIPDPRNRPLDQLDAADQAHEEFFTGESDFIGYLNLWKFYRRLKGKVSRNQLRKACTQRFLAYNRMREWDELHGQLRDAAADQRYHLNDTPAEPDAIHRALLTGLLNHLARRGDGWEYTGAHNRKCMIHPGSCMFDVRPKWIMAAELLETTRLYALNVAPVDPQWIEPLAGHLLTYQHTDPRWDMESARVIADERVTLFGLTVVPRRNAHYGPIDPVRSRELFIHHALVEGEFRTPAPFFEANRELIEEIERLQAKQREGNLLADTQTRFAFYDARIPENIHNGPAFEKWRKQAERDDPRRLFMSRDDVLAAPVDHLTPDLFPDKLEVSGTTLELDYVADPSDERDGVTVSVPVAMLNQVSTQELDWLVPGLLREKLIALLRSLPKSHRTAMVPIPNFAERLLPLLQHRRSEPLIEALTDCIAQMTHLQIPRELWDIDKLPEHLRINIAVVDEQGKTLASGRDLVSLRHQVGTKTEDAIQHAAPDQWHRDGIDTWDFGPLPEAITLERGDMAVRGFPAVVDAGDSASLRVVGSAEQATFESRRGIRRLFALHAQNDLAYVEYELDDLDQMAIQFATLGSRDQLLRDLLDAVVDRAFLDEQPLVRDLAAFDQRLLESRDRIPETARMLHGWARQIVALHHQVALALDTSKPAWQDVADEIRDQLRALLPEGFMADTPWPWLGQFPRYLNAIVRRLEKIQHGQLDRDRQRQADLAPFWRGYLATGTPSPRTLAPPMAQFRWMIEEFRVSLFAQDLGTAVPVSGKRLREQAQQAGVRINV